ARAIEHLVARVVRVPRLGGLERAARGEVGDDLGLTRLGLNLYPFQRPKVGGPPVLVVAPKSPHVLLGATVDLAPDLHSPGLAAVPRKPKLGVRDSEFRGPAERVDVRRSLPDRVIGRIPILMVRSEEHTSELQSRS